jgi:hypothetical protein
VTVTSRRKIEKFCKENGVSICLLEYERWGQHIYGDWSDESEWVMQYTFVCGGREHTYESRAYTADELIECVKDDVQSVLFNL